MPDNPEYQRAADVLKKMGHVEFRGPNLEPDEDSVRRVMEYRRQGAYDAVLEAMSCILDYRDARFQERGEGPVERSVFTECYKKLHLLAQQYSREATGERPGQDDQ